MPEKKTPAWARCRLPLPQLVTQAAMHGLHGPIRPPLLIASADDQSATHLIAQIRGALLIVDRARSMASWGVEGMGCST